MFGVTPPHHREIQARRRRGDGRDRPLLPRRAWPVLLRDRDTVPSGEQHSQHRGQRDHRRGRGAEFDPRLRFHRDRRSRWGAQVHGVVRCLRLDGHTDLAVPGDPPAAWPRRAAGGKGFVGAACSNPTFQRVPHPAKQYAQPFSWARFTAITPDGTIWTPGNRLATHSCFTAAPSVPNFFAIMPAFNVSAMLHTPTRAPFASSSSIPTPPIGKSPGCMFATGLRTAGAWVFGSVILNTSPNGYLAHIESFIANGMPEWRSTTTTLFSASVVP